MRSMELRAAVCRRSELQAQSKAALRSCGNFAAASWAKAGGMSKESSSAAISSDAQLGGLCGNVLRPVPLMRGIAVLGGWPRSTKQSAPCIVGARDHCGKKGKETGGFRLFRLIGLGAESCTESIILWVGREESTVVWVGRGSKESTKPHMQTPYTPTQEQPATQESGGRLQRNLANAHAV